MALDLFSGVDVFFFNFSMFKGIFIFISLIIVLYSLMFTLFLKVNNSFIVHNFLMNLFFSGLKDSKGFSLKGWFMFLWCFFIFITLGNLTGLLPYVYGVTTNIYVVLFLAIWGWSTIVLSSFVVNPFIFSGHFCPSGSPLALSWFLSIVEVISVVMRPGTLTLRLVAKMTTGHILVGLLTLVGCGLVINNSFMVSLVVLSILQFYLLFEMVICVIQGNVFFMLLGNYTSEHL